MDKKDEIIKEAIAPAANEVDKAFGPQEVAFTLMHKHLSSLSKELKDEWKVCVKQAAIDRKENPKGFITGHEHKAQMFLPRLAVMVLDKHWPNGTWQGNKEAMKWAWEEWPMLRRSEKY